MQKIDLKNTTKAKLIARLYCLQRNFNIDNFKTSEQVQNYCEDVVKNNFILRDAHVKNCATDLSLFLTGSKNCKFSKAIQ